jgi:two-component system CheB/CheR fusion protein
MANRKHPAATRQSTSAPTASQGNFAGSRGIMPVVGIGASAGGLDACRKLLECLPSDTGMAFILVQHLDPSHESLMASLLSTNTGMSVKQAEQDMPIEPNHLYVIPPGTYLSVAHGTLQVSPPAHQHGSRLPFDFLLHSIAAEYGTLGFCVVLSGTGADGTAGLASIKGRQGYAIAQTPDDAGYSGMPQSAISSGLVDLVAPASEIAAALVRHMQGIKAGKPDEAVPPDLTDRLPDIIELLRERTGQDFAPYKQGTLRRRIERRVGLAAITPRTIDTYLELLRSDPEEVEQLARDLLIHVTGFFRDTVVFDHLEAEILPQLFRDTGADSSLRVWIAGCSTGEEAYSFAILL